MRLFDPKPKSANTLLRLIQRQVDGLDPHRQHLYHQNIHNLVLLQFLQGIAIPISGLLGDSLQPITPG